MKKKPFMFVDYSKPGRGVKKGKTPPFTFGGFFPLLKRKIWGLFKTNLLWIFMNLPLLVGFYALSGKHHFTASGPINILYPTVAGIETISGTTPSLAPLIGALGLEQVISYPGPVAKVLYAITALAILTFGPANTGMAYILRGYTKEEYVDMPRDFFTTIKKNLWQSILLGVIDLAIIVMMLFALTFYSANSADFVFSVFFFVSIILSVIYVMARFYMYPLLVTFKLPLRKIFKNSFIFAILGFKRNIVALIFAGALTLINFLLLITPLTMAVGGILPFIMTVALISFITTYAAWPNIKKIMIDPYYTSDDSPENNTPEDEPVFVDRG